MMQFHTFVTSGGVRLRYAEQGNPAGEPFLMLHGWTDSSLSFSRVLPLLPSHVRAIVPDQRGHGESERPEGSYAPDVLAVDAIELLNALRIGSAVVIGHSMGSLVAQRMAGLAPERVKRLVLVGAGATVHTEAVAGMKDAIDVLEDPIPVEFVREFQRSMLHRPIPPDFFEVVVAESLMVPARVWKAAYAGMIEAGWVTSPGEIRCPTAMIWGERDCIFPRSAQDELLRRIPGARLSVMPEVGHAPPWEAPEEFLREAITLRASASLSS